MSKQTINYIFNITGNANEVINNIMQSTGVLNKSLSQTVNVFEGFKGKAVALQGVVSTIQSVNDAIGGITQAGANAELQLMNLKTLFGGNAEILRKRPTWKTFYAIMFVIYFFTILTKNRKDRKNYV